MGNEPVRLFCLNLQLAPSAFVSVQGFSDWIESALKLARPHYPTSGHFLLAFPEYISLPLAGLLAQPDEFSQTVTDLFASLAVQEGAYLTFCSPLLKEERLVNEAQLLDPSGQSLLTVQKRHLTGMEQKAGLVAVLEPPPVADTPFGRVGIAICLDAFDPAYVKKLADQGAQYLIMPSANDRPWAAMAESGRWQPREWAFATVGAVSAANAPIAFVINPMLRGKAGQDLEFDGQGSIVQASQELLPCPYLGVKEQFLANFRFCAPAQATGHSVGWIDST